MNEIAERLPAILESHKKWLDGKYDGKIADLSGADLRYAILRGADLIVFQSGLWTAFISSESIIIGCQHHSIEAWASFGDKAIADMHPHALEYWRDNKTIILTIAAGLKEKFKQEKAE